MGIAKVQHYVPQFLLRNFGNGKKDQLFVFDKQAGTSFRSNCRNVAAESRFYDIEFEGGRVTLEVFLGDLEAAAKPLLQRMLDTDSASIPDVLERVTLGSFFAVQLVRTRAAREQFGALRDAIAENLKARARSAEELEKITKYVEPPDTNTQKLLSFRTLMEAPRKLGPYFAEKVWHLVATNRARPFIIGDNPLAMHNAEDTKPGAHLGLGVRSIQLFFPLSPTRGLAMWCPDLATEFTSADEKLEYLRREAPHRLDEFPHADLVGPLAHSLKTGEALEYAPENVLHFNSLQVSNAERYVFSSSADFELPREMVTSHPHLRKGRRAVVA